MKTLSKRERVIKTLAHQEPDLVPIDIGSTASWFTENIYEKLKTHLNIKMFVFGQVATVGYVNGYGDVGPNFVGRGGGPP